MSELDEDGWSAKDEAIVQAAKSSQPEVALIIDGYAVVKVEALARHEMRSGQASYLAFQVGEALDNLGGMWSWNDAYLDDPANEHLWVTRAGRILRKAAGRPAATPRTEASDE